MQCDYGEFGNNVFVWRVGCRDKKIKIKKEFLYYLVLYFFKRLDEIRHWFYLLWSSIKGYIDQI